MTTTIIVIILIVLGIFSVKSYLKKIIPRMLCGETDSPAKKIKPQDLKKEHYRYCATMEIKGMTCSNCQRRIENIFNQIDGYYMEVDLDNHVATAFKKTTCDK